MQNITDPYFWGFDNRLPDYWRVQEWSREFNQYVHNGNLPSLTLLRAMHDHFGNFTDPFTLDGANTVETQITDNDYAVGLVAQTVAHNPLVTSPSWEPKSTGNITSQRSIKTLSPGRCQMGN